MCAFNNSEGDGMAIKLNHLHLKTRDPEQTANFYVETLGAKIVKRNPKGGYQLDLHGLTMNVTDVNGTQAREAKLGMEHIAMETDDLDGVVQRFKAQGIDVLEETNGSGGRRVCFFQGPDGVQLEFLESIGSSETSR
jgi:catechol 2,3-dioxygenase-like lactoylglutathione lyase family enzyme